MADTSSPVLPSLQKHQVVALQETATFAVKNPITSSTVTITRKQLPITPAFAMTDYKAQGKTMEKAIIDIESCSSLQSLYVMLSRVKSLQGLLILRPFKKCRLKKSKKKENDDLNVELLRLRLLSTSTMLSFSRSELDDYYLFENLRLRQQLKSVALEK